VTSADSLQDLATALDRTLAWLRRNSPPAELSMTARTTLSRLADDGPSRISDLARDEGVTQPAMTSLVNRLEAMGLVQRRADPSDGRAALAAITADGIDYIGTRRRQRAEVLARQLAGLSDDDQRALLVALPALERLIGHPATH
jgi:DNA-binding MarR family transcriptional regulator